MESVVLYVEQSDQVRVMQRLRESARLGNQQGMRTILQSVEEQPHRLGAQLLLRYNEQDRRFAGILTVPRGDELFEVQYTQAPTLPHGVWGGHLEYPVDVSIVAARAEIQLYYEDDPRAHEQLLREYKTYL
jgi:hypothetical protein